MNKDFNKIKIEYPFITGIKVSHKHGDEEYFGILLNHNDKITSFYDIAKLRDNEEKQNFMNIGENWWRETNRITPIHFCAGDDMDAYRHTLTHFGSDKCIEILFGPVISTSNILKKRAKKRNHCIPFDSVH